MDTILTKKDFQDIINSEKKIIDINFSKFKMEIENTNLSNLSEEEIEAYLDRYFLETINLFYKLNSILVKIKYKMHKNLNPETFKERLNLVFGEKNGNNFDSLINHIIKTLKIKNKNFDDLILYFNIVETFIRHQYSHGFSKAIYYNVYNHSVMFFYNKEIWKKYKDEEKNRNCFFMCFQNRLLDESDFLHYSKNMLVLNSFSSRLVCQFTSFHEDINLKREFRFSSLKSKAFDGIYFKFYSLEFCWQKLNSENSINNIIKLNNNRNKIDIYMREIYDLLMFPDDSKCYNTYESFEKSNWNIKVLRKKIKSQNKEQCLFIFIKIIEKHKKFIKEDVIYNTHTINILKDIFGNFESSEKIDDYVSKIKNANNKKEYEEIFNFFYELNYQFIAYKANKDFEINQAKLTRYYTENPMIINYENVYKQILCLLHVLFNEIEI